MVVLLEDVLGRRIERWSKAVPRRQIPAFVRQTAPAIATRTTAYVLAHPRLREEFEFERKYLEGIEALHEHDLPSAVEALSAAVALAPSNVDARYNLAIAQWWAEEPQETILATISACRKLGIDAERASFLTGLELFLSQHSIEALGHFTKFQTQRPSDRDALYGLFEAQFHAGRPHEAIATYKRLSKLYPSFRLGAQHAIMFALSRADDAEIRWALRRDLEGPDAGRWRAMRELSQRRYRAALAILQAELDRPGLERRAQIWLERTLVGALLLLRQTELAQAHLQALLARTSHEPVPEHALDVMSGGAERLAEGRASLLKSAQQVAARNKRWGADLLLRGIETELGAGLSPNQLVQALDRINPPDNERNPRVQIVRALLAMQRKDAAALRPLTRTGHHEVDAAARGGLAMIEQRWSDAAKAFGAAAEASNDGRFILSFRRHQAQALRALDRLEAAAQACDEVVRPRKFEWSWGGLIGPCLATMMRAHEAARAPELLREAAQAILLYRSEAPKDDPLRARAREAIARAAALQRARSPRPR